jgi:hypothetical protein
MNQMSTLASNSAINFVGLIRRTFQLRRWGWWLFLPMVVSLESASAQTKGEIEIALVDSQTQQRLISRVQLRGPNNNLLKPKSLDSVQGWHLVDGSLRFRGKPGDYRYEVFRGPEYAAAQGQFTLDKNSELLDDIKIPRHANLMQESWAGGDLLSFLSLERSQKWLDAEGLMLAAAARPLDVGDSVNNQPQVAANFSSYWDQRGLVLHHWQPQGELPEKYPTSRLLVLSKQKSAENGSLVNDERLPVHVEIQKLWAAELPIWLASGRIDSVQLLGDHLTIDGHKSAVVAPVVAPEGNYRGGRGPGQIVEQIYWQMLEAGFRIPPTAGSGFGRTSSPLGYNRVYALVGSRTQQNWWQAVRAGNTFVTNGPLLRVTINGRPPGSLFQADVSVELDVEVQLTTADPVEYLEVVNNGQSLYRVALDEHARLGGKIPTLGIKESGWLVIRVVTQNEVNYRMATSAPFYFEIDGRPRITQRSVDYFQRWLSKTQLKIQELPASERLLQEPFLKAAEKFWRARHEQCTTP